MKITRFVPAPDGGSRFVDLDVAIDNAQTDAFGHTSHRSGVIPAQSTVLGELPAGLEQDWHPASRRQILAILSGSVEIRSAMGRSGGWDPARCSSPTIAAAAATRPARSAARRRILSCTCRPISLSVELFAENPAEDRVGFQLRNSTAPVIRRHLQSMPQSASPPGGRRPTRPRFLRLGLGSPVRRQPLGAGGTLERAVDNDTGSVVFVCTSLAVALWSATGAMTAVMRGLNRASGVAETRGFVRKRLVALGMLLMSTAGLLLCAGLLVLARCCGLGCTRDRPR